ncbi:MAG TPA: carboxypeptidase-like regulatory domain-containing protein [Polyangiaceae bacterium LLY-WYZ-15_(1-7)]|nr:hypothetical protein [Myxococcales bacterium]MAT25974.1 hypothetical protein [Sandaracinus sp.]HJL03237.1 carboxypeptidase-like regulatory domain-containing protein [Polyangiaceae bacterium LLY-WYZ-15_(1-7)]MBJ74382.1 hypothetical protein [Sandaracinus sp.]HJL11173.1 carboxypeptidase-like regulatory domain-containing protein [Polyangiaceae bacterium LLY-WYZ-15_(1-7)]
MRPLLAALAFLAAAPAWAQAQGAVRVRVVDSAGRPLDGQVTLQSTTPGQGTRGCRTVAGRCTVQAPAGSYRVSVRPVRETAPPVQTLSVREGVTASLTLRCRRTTAATTGTATAPQVQRATTVRTRTATSPTTSPSPTGTTRTDTPRTTTPRRVTPRTATPRRVTPRTVTPRTTTPRRVTPRTVTPRTAPTDPAPRSTRTTIVRTAAPAEANTQIREDEPPNLASGERLCLQGRVVDQAGRPADATLTVRRGETVVGRVRSVAGRFSVFDLPAGTYEVEARSARTGALTRTRWSLGSAVARVTLRIR